MQHLLLRDTARHSENFIYIINQIQKQKLQLSKLKSAILQLNNRYYCNCYNENANKINYMKFIWKDKCPLNSEDLIPLEFHVWDATLKFYQCYTPKPTDTYGTEERPKLMQQYCRSAKGFRRAKSSYWTFRTCCLIIDVTSIIMTCFFTIIKTVSISCNWTDQLLFTYKMALCNSHSQGFIFYFIYLFDSDHKDP